MRLSLLIEQLYSENNCLRKKGCRKNLRTCDCGIVKLCWFGGVIEEFLGLDINGITNNSKRSSSDSLFVCIKGERYDGNEFLEEAGSLGARVFVSENENIKIKYGAVIIVKNARKTMAELCRIVYAFPRENMRIVGITGTKGKTTVTETLSRALRSLGVKTLSIGTLGIVGVEGVEIANTTPDSCVLYPLLKRGYEEGISVAVIEVSSQALKDFRVWGIRFDYVAFTSLGYDHIGKGEHESFSDYLAAKRSLFTSYGASCAVVNYDDPYSAFFSSGVPRVIRCGITPHSDFLISDMVSDFSGMSFSLSGELGKARLPGVYNAVNIAIAVAVAKELTHRPIAEILDKISDIKLSGRFEYYNIHSRFAVIDYAHNEKSLCDLIALVKQISRGKIIAVFGSVGGRSFRRRRELARAAEKFADFSVLTSDNPNFENPLSIASDIYSAFTDKTRAKIVLDRCEAIKYAFTISSPSDAILLLGKGHEDYMLVKGEKHKFSEREILKMIDKDFPF